MRSTVLVRLAPVILLRLAAIMLRLSRWNTLVVLVSSRWLAFA